MNTFSSITFLPDGHIYDQNNWEIVDLAKCCPMKIKELIFLDSVKRNHIIESPIGQLEFVWSGSNIFGVSTLLKDGVTLNAGIFLSGVDSTKEKELRDFYLESWREFNLVKELSGGNKPFLEAEKINNRPLCISINWATLSKDEYDKIAYYDLFIASIYFSKQLGSAK
jgi:hypothetical protein